MSSISSKFILSFKEISIVSILELNLASNCSMRILIIEILSPSCPICRELGLFFGLWWSSLVDILDSALLSEIEFG